MGRKFNADSKAKVRTRIIVTKSSSNSNVSGELEFQFNPENIEYGRSAKYVSIESPGMAYPLTQFVNGEVSEFSFQAFFYDKPYTKKIHNAKEFLKNVLMPPQRNKKKFKTPPIFLLTYGGFAKRCVLLSYHIDSEERDKKGRPVVAYITLTVRQVGTVDKSS